MLVIQTHLDLFTGIGGFSLAAKYAGMQTTTCVEIDLFCQKVLRKNFPNAKIHSDITTYRGTRGSHDLITFGSPCQDLSIAGKQKGLEGDRSILFYEAVRLINEIRPQGFIMENVPNVTKWFDRILPSLSCGGMYELCWFSLSLEKLGGAHRRNRVFILGKLANHDCGSSQASRHQINQARTNQALVNCPLSTGCGGTTKSRMGDQLHGIPEGLANCLMNPQQARETAKDGLTQKKVGDRTGKLQALGNAVTPQQAYVAMKIWINWLNSCDSIEEKCY